MRRYFINYDSEVVHMAAYHGLSEELQERIREDQRRHWVNPCVWYPLPQRRDGDAGIPAGVSDIL